MDNVKESLKILITGENDAVYLYDQFYKQSLKDGYKNIALLFKALVMAEKIHIKNHMNALGEEFIPEINTNINVESTLNNIKSALKSEVEENKKLYPRLIKNIKKDCNSDYGKVARLSMLWAKLVEKEHARLLKLAYKSLIKNQDFKFNTISICQVCGNIVLNKIRAKECSVCGHDTIFFKSISEEKK